MTGLIFLDTETTGLDLMTHDIWEIAWAIDHEPVVHGLVRHTLDHYDDEALAVNNYRQRCNIDIGNIDTDVEDALYATFKDWPNRIGRQLTVVGANPHFDLYRLSRRWNWDQPWAYRAIDVSVMAMEVFKTELPLSLNALIGECREYGYEIPEPDHSAAADVEATRAAFYAMRLISLTGN